MNDKDPYQVPGLVPWDSPLSKSFTPQNPEKGLAEIARSLGVTRSAAFRTVHTLLSEGYLLEVPDKSRYRLGPQVLSLSYGFLGKSRIVGSCPETIGSVAR